MSHIDSLAPTLCSALANEIRDVRTLIEQLADVLACDEYLALKYTEQLQAFDLLVQRISETAGLLDRLAEGISGHDAVSEIRLEVMQRRLQDVLKAA
jgi:hypothetical protein